MKHRFWRHHQCWGEQRDERGESQSSSGWVGPTHGGFGLFKDPLFSLSLHPANQGHFYTRRPFRRGPLLL